MKICPTCRQQYPNGFQYCPDDTELLVQSEDYFRRTQALEAPVAAPAAPQPPAPANGPLPATEPLSPTQSLPSSQSLPSTQSLNAATGSLNRRTEKIAEPAPAPAQPAIAHSRATEKANGKTAGAPAAAPNGRKATVTQKIDLKADSNPGMAFMLPEQPGLMSQIRDGFGVFFQYFGRAPKERSISEFVDQESLLKRISSGATLFFKYFGKQPAAAGGALLLPERGSIFQSLKESARIFIDDFGKKPPEVVPGQMGLLSDEPIYTRVGRELKLAAADFRRNPRAFMVSLLKGDGSTRFRQRLLQAGIAAALIAYAFIFTSFLLGSLLRFGGTEQKEEAEKLELQALVAPPPVEVKVADAPKEMPKGKGGFTGGSKPKIEQARGGGGGGREQPTPPSQGNPPQMALTPQIVPPNPEPPKIKNPSLPVASTVYGDPKALPDMKGPIGDPRGIPAPPSSGPGSGDGIGSGRGSGVGVGEGGGVGPGRGGNAGGGDMAFGGGRGPGGSGGVHDMGRDGVGRIQILYKEKAKYTEEARQNKVQGTVVLSAVFTSDGRVQSIRVVRGLPDGLTEKAIEAAQKIRFKPAEKNGAPVTVRGQLEFTFNLY
ncbi:MAG: energy transducer TonB [Acidobacteria bacterium]|nr:energy transducer TonB [Acidobacteriota bacterium]